jgi:hypothetical protein
MDYFTSQYGVAKDTLYYVVHPDIEVNPEAKDPSEGYEMMDQEMTARAPCKGRSFVNDRRKFWYIMSYICGEHSCFVYIKPTLRTMNRRDAYIIMSDHFIGPNNVGNMASAAETNLPRTLYNGEKKCFTWEAYVRIQNEQYSVLNGLKYYGYAGIDDSSKVCQLLKGINTTELDVCKTQVMANPSLCDYFTATVEIYSTLIKKMKAVNTPLNVSEVSFARAKSGKNLFGKRNSTGISNVSNATVDGRFFEKHVYHALTPDQNNILRLKHLKRGHVRKGHTGNGNDNGNVKNSGKGATLKSLTHSIAALSTKIDKFSLPHDDCDDDDEYSDEKEGTSNLSDAALTRQRKKKKRVNN